MSAPKGQRSNPRKGIQSSYSKYKCQYKNKAILTKLSNDSGYPQEILNPSDYSSPRQKSNYIQENKKNLKNFFKERIPAENILLSKLMKREADIVHPKRIFQIKQMEFQLKHRAKTNLIEQQLQLSNQSNFQKVTANFHVHDRSKELKQKFGGKLNLSYYEEQNYRRGTQSHIGKRSKILKKQAYDKVFGPDVSALSRTAAAAAVSTERVSPRLKAKSTTLDVIFKEEDHHKTIRSLINKLNSYKNKLQDRDEHCHIPFYEDPSKNNGHSNLVKMLENMSKFYQGRNIAQGRQKIQKMQDLGKLFKQYYVNLLNHKTSRLKSRNKMIYQTVSLSPTEDQSRQFQSAQLEVHNQSFASLEDVDCNQEEEAEQSKLREEPIFNVKYRFKLLNKTLVRWASLFYIYGIKRVNIFLAFRSNRQPYQLQGSYAFFKCIKMGDLASVKTFVSKNPKYLFESQFYGKSPLSYACVYNQLQIAKFIIEQGVNSDKLCNNKKTSLYYALKTNSVELIKLILQRGASPWSSPKNPYAQLIRAKGGQNGVDIQNLFNSSKKIYIGMQIQQTISKKKIFWQRNSSKITQKQRINYGCYNL